MLKTKAHYLLDAELSVLTDRERSPVLGNMHLRVEAIAFLPNFLEKQLIKRCASLELNGQPALGCQFLEGFPVGPMLVDKKHVLGASQLYLDCAQTAVLRLLKDPDVHLGLSLH